MQSTHKNKVPAYVEILHVNDDRDGIAAEEAWSGGGGEQHSKCGYKDHRNKDI
jgi:hypothetical protein